MHRPGSFGVWLGAGSPQGRSGGAWTWLQVLTREREKSLEHPTVSSVKRLKTPCGAGMFTGLSCHWQQFSLTWTVLARKVPQALS